MATIFVSPGVYTKEQDFTIFASRIGLTRLGLVGLTQKGPAFEAIKVRSTDEFLLRFGSTDPDLPLPYVANSFLSQSNELTITRVLGTEGFENSGAWLIVASTATTFSGTVTVSGLTLTKTHAPSSVTYTFTLTASTGSVNGVTATTVGNDTYVGFLGATSADLSDALESGTFGTYGVTIGAGDTTPLSASSFNLAVTTAEPLSRYSGATLAVLRSKRNQISDAFYLDQESDVKIGYAGVSGTFGDIPTVLGSFVLSATTGPLTALTNSAMTVSLDASSNDYIVKLLGKTPEVVSGQLNLYVERIYSNFIREAASRGEIVSLNPSLVYTTEESWKNFETEYTNAITPWIVSRVIGSDVRDLFRFQTISDGDASNSEIKISIANIDPTNLVFDVVVRRFEDTDATASQTALERFSNVTLNPSEPNYIARVIGTTDELYPRKSMFITVDMAENHPISTVPAGFKGYTVRNSGISGTTAPDLYYKTTYLSGDTVFKTYLGISELGYTSYTTSLVGTRNAIKSLEKDLFEYIGAYTATGTSTLKGFHMENTADSTLFVSGDKSSLTAYTNTAGTALDKNKLKFTLVPAGGFDGWDKYRQYTYPYERFTPARVNNVQAFKDAIDTFNNPEAIDINVFATPGIDLQNNTELTTYGLDMVESRTDSIYIMDSPRITVGTNKGTPEEAVAALESTGYDSNYAATYWPWIQIEDPNTNEYTYQAPTLMVVKALALTDNVAAPWFAPAGINRGVGSDFVVRADLKLTLSERDTLYEGRINPIATFVQQGVVIWGQKTMQVRQSALDRINVRRLLLQVRRLVAAASLTLVFEQNDQTLRDEFLAKVEPLLLQIQNQRGLTAFKVVVDDTLNTPDVIDRNTLVGKIQLQPTRTAEFIDLTFQVLPTGANFQDF